MIVDFALMFAAFMVARLFRSMMGGQPKTREGKAALFLLPNIIDLLAALAIGYLAYDIHTISSTAASQFDALRRSPGFSESSPGFDFYRELGDYRS